MNNYQKALFTQLQVAGLGIVVMAMGILRYDSLKIFIFVGAGIFLFGLIRFLTLKKLMKNIALNDDPAVDDNPVLKESFSWRNLVDSQENLQESDDKKEKKQ